MSNYSTRYSQGTKSLGGKHLNEQSSKMLMTLSPTVQASRQMFSPRNVVEAARMTVASENKFFTPRAQSNNNRNLGLSAT